MKSDLEKILKVFKGVCLAHQAWSTNQPFNVDEIVRWQIELNWLILKQLPDFKEELKNIDPEDLFDYQLLG